MTNHVETLDCNDCGVGFENEPGEPSQIKDGLCNTCARPRLLEDNKRLRAAIVAWGQAESLHDCPACAVFNAALR